MGLAALQGIDKGGAPMGAVKKFQDLATGIESKGEGEWTEMIEEQTAQIPSIAYLSFGVAAMGISLALLLAGRRNVANFVGQWVPTILIMGLYNKMVKQHGHD
jgi:hypothetical protein